MVYKESYYNTIEVRLFLAKQFPYAAQCFGMEHTSETVKVTAIEKWFKRYFPAETAFSLFRQMEATITGYMEVDNG